MTSSVTFQRLKQWLLEIALLPQREFGCPMVVFRFPSWKQWPELSRLFLTCKYLKPLLNLILNMSNQACSCKRKTDSLRFFSCLSCCICKSFIFNQLLMSYSPSFSCPQHITNRLIVFQCSISTTKCLTTK